MTLSPHPSCQAAVWRATERAAASGVAMWVAAGASLGLRDPLALVRSSPRSVQMAFMNGDRQRAWLGLGSADDVVAGTRAEALASLDEVRQRLSRIETAGLALRDEIRYLGGLAFDGDGPAHPDWPAGTAARWILPSILVSWTPGADPDAFATVIVPVHPGDGPEVIISRLDLLFDELVQGGARLGHATRSGEAEQAPLTAARQGQWSARRSRSGRRSLSTTFFPPARQDGPEREDWIRRIRRVVGRLDPAKKVVLARQIALPTAERLDPWDLFTRIDPATGSHRFCFRFDRERTFLGGSPERLVRLEGDRLESDCLAGTIARDPDPVRDRELAGRLLASDKDRHEHALVREFLVEALNPLCRTLNVPESPRLLGLPHLHHLHTPVLGIIRPDISLSSLVGALHPTPAVCGTPREEALDLIRETESTPRGWYAGAIGHVGVGTLDLAVGIRSVLLGPDRATVFAGGGLVAASDPESEFEETERKAEPWVQLVQELGA
jgi:isochorismate synthase